MCFQSCDGTNLKVCLCPSTRTRNVPNTLGEVTHIALPLHCRTCKEGSWTRHRLIVILTTVMQKPHCHNTECDRRRHTHDNDHDDGCNQYARHLIYCSLLQGVFCVSVVVSTHVTVTIPYVSRRALRTGKRTERTIRAPGNNGMGTDQRSPYRICLHVR